MAAHERHQNIRVRVEIILRQHLCHFIYVLAFAEGVAQRIKEREIEQRIEPGIHAVKAHASSLKKGGMYGIAVFHFAKDAKAWILALDRLHPLTPEAVRHVLPRIFAYAVEARRPDPP